MAGWGVEDRTPLILIPKPALLGRSWPWGSQYWKQQAPTSHTFHLMREMAEGNYNLVGKLRAFFGKALRLTRETSKEVKIF